jgi:hypothetical protein
MRDPRDDPRPGDEVSGVYRRHKQWRRVKSVTNTRVVFTVPGLTLGSTLESWRAWAKTATVVKKGDQP